jgi:hypothetical protein
VSDGETIMVAKMLIGFEVDSAICPGNTDKALQQDSAAAIGAILGTHNMRPDIDGNAAIKEQRSLSQSTSSRGDDGVIQQ